MSSIIRNPPSWCGDTQRHTTASASNSTLRPPTSASYAPSYQYFSLYVQPIGNIIRAHGMLYHQYADDLQLYCHSDLNSQALAEVVPQIENCIDELKRWMSANLLSMNDSRTQYLPNVPTSMVCLVDRVKIRVGEDICCNICAQPWRLLRSSFGHELARFSRYKCLLFICATSTTSADICQKLLKNVWSMLSSHPVLTIVIHCSTTAHASSARTQCNSQTRFMSSPTGQCHATFTGTALATNRTEDRIQAFIHNFQRSPPWSCSSLYLRPSPCISTDSLSSFFQQQRTGSSMNAQ